ncbi:MAG: hypothetical protein RR767_09360 [Acinetobacter sp.]
MKIQTAIEIRNSRKNLMAFLHRSDISTIEDLLGQELKRPVVWDDVCNQVIEAYNKKLIKNKAFSQIFEILMQENSSLRTERYRLEGKRLYVFSESQKAYVFLKQCTSKEYNMNYANMYID